MWSRLCTVLVEKKATTCVCVILPESLTKPRQQVKPLPQRKAMSVHEDTLAMTQGKMFEEIRKNTDQQSV